MISSKGMRQMIRRARYDLDQFQQRELQRHALPTRSHSQANSLALLRSADKQSHSMEGEPRTERDRIPGRDVDPLPRPTTGQGGNGVGEQRKPSIRPEQPTSGERS